MFDDAGPDDHLAPGYFDESLLDDPQAQQRIDETLRAVAGWGAEVRRAMAAADDALRTLAVDRPRAVVASGPDGRLFRAVLEPVCPVPFVAWPFAGLPGWAGPLDLVVVLSVEGTDEETLPVVREAVRRGCAVLAVAPANSPLADAVAGRGVLLAAGSADPLALSVPVLVGLGRLGLGPDVDAESVAQALDEVAIACGPSAPVTANPAKELALVLADRVPLVWGGSVLAARAARRVAEALRPAAGRPALAGDEHQLLPVLDAADPPDLFADPFADPLSDIRVAPALVLLDDGSEAPEVLAARARLEAMAQSRGIRTQVVEAMAGSHIARFAALLATGRYAAAYLRLGLGRPESGHPRPDASVT